MSLLQICAFAVLAAALAFLLRAIGPKIAAIIPLFAGLALFAFALSRYKEPIAALLELAERANMTESVGRVLSMIFVGFLCSMAADVCRDVGEASLAARVEFCGRAEIFLLSLPFLLDIFSAAWEMIT